MVLTLWVASDRCFIDASLRRAAKDRIFGWLCGAWFLAVQPCSGSLFTLHRISSDLRQTDTLLVLMLIVVVSYLAMLSLSLTFLDAQIPVDSRTLSPIYVPSMILLIALLARFGLAPESRSHARVAGLYVSGATSGSSASELDELASL